MNGSPIVRARYEVSTYFVFVDSRTVGNPTQRRVPAGFDVDVYGNGLGHHHALLSIDDTEFRATLEELCAACREAVAPLNEASTIEIIPAEATVILNVKSHLDPEAQVRIRITHSRGLEQLAGVSEEKALADVEKRLQSLGVKRT